MQTRKLYYEDSHLSSFEAQVVSCRSCEKGWLVELDRTAFYPEGGGQASDLGVLGGVRVTDVQDSDGTVWHLCDGALEAGSTVSGEIDYARRFDLMQQHSGEHILSGLIHAKFGYHNVGFHMGADAVTIDFDGDIPADDLPELEAKANEAVWKDIPLHIWTPSPEELPNVTYRTKRALEWPVRIVEIPGYDTCACCGTHVSRTGEIGPIKVLSCIRFRSGVRMEILCGRRALEYLSRSHAQNQEVSRAFSAPVTETGEAARKMNDLLAQLRFELGAMERQMFALIADSCEGRGNVLIFRENLSSGSLRQLADLTAQKCGGIAAVFSGSDEDGYGYCLVQHGGDLRQMVRDMNAALDGRGGGKPAFQQGSLKAHRDRIKAQFPNFFCME